LAAGFMLEPGGDKRYREFCPVFYHLLDMKRGSEVNGEISHEEKKEVVSGYP
jgi:hypothetical protein